MELVPRQALNCITGFCVRCRSDAFPIMDSQMFWCDRTQRWTIVMNHEFGNNEELPHHGDYVEKVPGSLGIHPMGYSFANLIPGEQHMLELVHDGCVEQWVEQGLLDEISKSDNLDMFWTKV